MIVVGIALTIVLSACDQANLMTKMAESEDATIAQDYIKEFRAGNLDKIEEKLDASVKAPNVHELLVAMERQFPPQEPISVKLVGA
jgi:hypothetical protein